MEKKTSSKSKNKKNTISKQLRTISSYDTTKRISNKIKHTQKNKICLSYTNTTNNNHSKNKVRFKKQIITEPHDKNIQNQLNFIQAVEVIFKTIECNNKGIIEYKNINKITNQIVLYFLGTLFQKIKQNKMSLTLGQFIIQCIKIQNQSSHQDLQQFIKQSKSMEFKRKSKRYQINLNTIQDQRQQINQLSNTQPPQQNNFNNRSLINKTLPIRRSYFKKEQKKQKNIPLVSIPIQKNNLTKTKDNIFQKKNLNLKIEYCGQYTDECIQSPSFNYLDKENKRKIQIQVDTARLNRLAFKVEDYIKKNQERAKRNRDLLKYI